MAEHKEQTRGAVETAGAPVDQKTRGRYTDKIVKYGQKASNAVEKFGDQASGLGSAQEPPDAPAAATPSAEKSDGGAADS